MKKTFYIILVTWMAFLCGVYGEIVLMDFSGSHRLENIKGLNLFNMHQKSDDGEESYHAENIEVSISLPGGQNITTDTQSVKIQARADGAIHYIELLGPIMPQDEAYNAGKKLYTAFSIPYDRLEKWKMDVESVGVAAKTVANAQGMYYPHIFIEIRHSMNRLYPWTILMSLGWIDENEERHNESWGHENNPKPPPGLETVSLEPPSGRTYSRADAWEEANRRQEELDKQLGQVRGPDGQLINSSDSSPVERAERRTQKLDEQAAQNREATPPWWLVALPFVVLSGWFAFRIYVKHRGS